MFHARIDITPGLDGEPVVLALFDLSPEDVAAAAYAVKAVSGQRFRNTEMAVDDVLELRELTALADELDNLAGREGIGTVVLRPARLTAFRSALTHFVEDRDEAEWMRDDDREPLGRIRELLWPLGELAADAMRAALTPPATHSC